MSRDREAAYEVVSRTGQRGVPVIAVDGQYVIGFNRPRLERLLAAAASGRPRFGAAVADAPGGAGARVGRIRPGSPAEQAGLEPGDIVVELDRRPVRGADELERALAGLRPGDVITVAFTRHGERHVGRAQV